MPVIKLVFGLSSHANPQQNFNLSCLSHFFTHNIIISLRLELSTVLEHYTCFYQRPGCTKTKMNNHSALKNDPPQRGGHPRRSSFLSESITSFFYFSQAHDLQDMKTSAPVAKMNNPSALKNGHPRTRGHPLRSVSFSSESTLTFFDSNYLKDLKNSLWYTSEDEDRFKTDAREELAAFRLLKERSPDEAPGKESCPQHLSSSMCIVGLEQYLISRDHSRKRTRIKKLVKCAVFDAQAAACTLTKPQK